jgi:putative ABC transport system substrate-binding protein
MPARTNRRIFIAALGGAAAWPLTTRAQQSSKPVIGYLGTSSPAEENPGVTAFVLGLKESGYVEGQNVAIEFRWADGHYDHLPELAADLVQRHVTVIAAPGSVPAALAAKAATTTIPIVFSAAVDPVKAGLVASLNRPGGNVTGATSLNAEVGPKRLELMHEVVPTVTTIELLVNPTNANAQTLSRDAQDAALTPGIQLRVLHASTERDFEKVQR